MEKTFTLFRSLSLLVSTCLFVMLGTTKAQVIYTAVNNAQGAYMGNLSYDIDLNKDNTVDFSVSILHMQYQEASAPGGYYDEYSARVSANDSNEVCVDADILLAFAPNAVIDNSLNWSVNGYLSRYYFDGKGKPYERFGSSAAGNFVNGTGKYVGVKLKANGKTYFGYIAVDTKNLDNSSGSFTVTGFAYEYTADKSIAASAGATVAVVDAYMKNNTSITYADHTIIADFKQSFIGKIALVNMSGQTLVTAPVNGISSSVSVAGVPSGVYQVVVSGPEGSYAEKLLITER